MSAALCGSPLGHTHETVEDEARMEGAVAPRRRRRVGWTLSSTASSDDDDTSTAAKQEADSALNMRVLWFIEHCRELEVEKQELLEELAAAEEDKRSLRREVREMRSLASQLVERLEMERETREAAVEEMARVKATKTEREMEWEKLQEEAHRRLAGEQRAKSILLQLKRELKELRRTSEQREAELLHEIESNQNSFRSDMKAKSKLEKRHSKLKKKVTGLEKEKAGYLAEIAELREQWENREDVFKRRTVEVSDRLRVTDERLRTEKEARRLAEQQITQQADELAELRGRMRSLEELVVQKASDADKLEDGLRSVELMEGGLESTVRELQVQLEYEKRQRLEEQRLRRVEHVTNCDLQRRVQELMILLSRAHARSASAGGGSDDGGEAVGGGAAAGCCSVEGGSEASESEECLLSPTAM